MEIRRINGLMQNRNKAFVEVGGVLHFVSTVGGSDGTRGENKQKNIRRFNASMDLLLKVCGSGGDVLLIKPGTFALELQGIIEATGKARISTGVRNEDIQR